MSGILTGFIYGPPLIIPPVIPRLILTKNVAELNLRTLLLTNGWDGVSVLTVEIEIVPGVIIFSNSTSAYALQVGLPYPAGSVITLINKGRIIGKGGEGGSWYVSGGSELKISPKVGGPALLANSSIHIDNQGIIGGGGGGGGIGGGYFTPAALYNFGAGGGGGVNFGAGGISIGGYFGGSYFATSGGNGANGDFYVPGAGGPGYSSVGNGNLLGGKGGAGGTYGASGANGQTVPAYKGGYPIAAVPGAAGGAAIVGNTNITWIATGARYGTIT